MNYNSDEIYKSEGYYDYKYRLKFFYKPIKINKKDNEINYFIEVIKIFAIFLFFYSCFSKNITKFFIKNGKVDINRNNNTNYSITEDILDVQIYENFEKMKERYIIDSFFKPYLDNINILSHLYHKKIENFKENKNNIHICMSFNDKYIYEILVPVTMTLINCDKNNTFITYHFLCTPDVKNTTLSILKSLIYKYYSNLEMIFYDMGNNFVNRNDKRLSQAACYRILTPIFIDIERLIYLDGDTLILKDLNEMYQLEFNDNYILGILDVLSRQLDSLGIKSEKYINSGVILLNLEKIRNDNKNYELINITNSDKYFNGVDQTILNYVFYPKIGILPSKFGIWNFSDKKDIKIYLSHLRTKLDINELEESFLNPTIIHTVLCIPKACNKVSYYRKELTTCKERGNCFCEKYHNLWYYYAKKTDYYDNIKDFYNKKNFKSFY